MAEWGYCMCDWRYKSKPDYVCLLCEGKVTKNKS
jgi:hypothetical protein